MATYYSQSSGVWSTLSRWNTNAGGGGSSPTSIAAMEDHIYIIQAGHTIDYDIDTSAWTVGFQTITITGSNSTPGMLRCDSTTLPAGTYNVKMKTGFSIVGTASVTNLGRILANSDGDWATTTALANDRKFFITSLTGTSTVDTITATNLSIRLFCTQPTIPYVEIYGVPFVVTFNNTTEKFTIVSPTNTPAIPPNGTPITLTGTLPAELTAGTTYYVKAVSGATGELEASIGGGTINLSNDGSGTIYMHYGCWGPVAQATNVNTTTGVITWNGVPPAANTAVKVRSSGTLPTGLSEDSIYYVRTISGNTCKLSLISGNDVGIVIPTAVGSGNISMYCGSSYTNSKVMNVLQDVTTDWTTTVGGNGSNVVLCDIAPENYDQQRDVLATIGTKVLVFTTNNVDSIQFPLARIYLTARNVAIKSASTGASSLISGGTGNVFQCELSRAAASGTTFYGTAIINSSSNNTISGTITGCTTALNSSSNNTISGTITGCSTALSSSSNNNISGTITGCGTALNSSSNNTISGAITGCSIAHSSSSNNNTISGAIIGCSTAHSSSSNNTISGTITGCSTALSSSSNNTISGAITGCGTALNSSSNNNTISGAIIGCTIALSSSSNNTISGTITGCNIALNSSSSNNTISGAIINCTTLCVLGTFNYATLINTQGLSTTPTFSGRNAVASQVRIASENHGAIEGAMKIFENFGDIVKTTRTGDGPAGATGDCIEVSNLQSNLGYPAGQVVPNPLPIFMNHRIWLPAATHIVTYKTQNTFTSGIAAGNLKLTARYITTGGLGADVSAAPALAIRADASDWTQTLAVTFTSVRAGWVDFRMDLYQTYQAGKAVFVWPTPVIT